MMIGTGRRRRLWTPQIVMIALAGIATAISGCSSDTPTAPADTQSEPTIRRVAIDDTLGAVGGYVFDDMNQNGTRDEGEPGLEGLIVMLADASSMTQADTTDADGEYEFDDLEPGMFIVSAPVVEGWTNTTQLNVQVQVNAAEMAMVDHGLFMEETGGDTGTIDGVVFSDMNQNGMMDEGEVGLEDLTVGLIFPDDKTEGTKTDADGQYEFSDLTPDVYTVVAPMVEGWMLTTPDSVQAKVVADSTVTVVFGLYMEETGGETGSVSGTVFDDMNQNGMMDEGEMGLKGLTVGIVYADGKTEGAQTDADGNYSFEELLPGDYTVVGPSVEGWMLTTLDSVQVNVIADMTVNVDFGLYMEETGGDPTSIGGKVYEDLNGNGMYDDGEPGIAGVEVRISSREAPRNRHTKKGCGIHRYTTTDENGMYLFEDVDPGKWRVTPKKPHGYHRSSPKDVDVSVEEGEAVEGVNFGFTKKHNSDGDCDDDDDDWDDDHDDDDDDDDDED